MGQRLWNCQNGSFCDPVCPGCPGPSQDPVILWMGVEVIDLSNESLLNAIRDIDQIVLALDVRRSTRTFANYVNTEIALLREARTRELPVKTSLIS